MARARKDSQAKTGATLGFEAKLWATADALRGSMDAAEYKHVVLGLIFLKYICQLGRDAMAGAPLKTKKQLTC